MWDSTATEIRNDALAEDAQYVSRCRIGDETAMRVLIERHRRKLVRIAANSLRDTYEAEDVAQEAFLKAFRELRKLRDDRAFAGFLYRICIRLCLDRLRSRRPEPAIVDKPLPSGGSQIETRILVSSLLEHLTPDLRLTLVLREMEQLSYDEIAEVMDVPVGTVRSRLHTARERFRTLWLEATGSQHA
jgi:RNA polymerase sigma-70 factor (ECF subfamily)